MKPRTLLMFVLLLGVISTIAATLILPGCERTTDVPPGYERVTIGDRTFEMKVANTPEARSRGLGGVAEIPDDGGMLFVFREPAIQSFWMYDCLVDIDIAYLDTSGFITAMYEMKAQPLQQPDEDDDAYERRLRASGQYLSGFPACFVLEFKAGTMKQLGLKFGDKIQLDYARLREEATPEPPGF